MNAMIYYGKNSVFIRIIYKFIQKVNDIELFVFYIICI